MAAHPAAPAETGALDLEDVHVDLGGRPVLRGASLRVEPGEVVGITGPNGAGKSTLLRVAAGLLAPARGRATLAGMPVRSARRRGWIGWSGPGEARFTRRLSLAANLLAAAGTLGIGAAEAQRRIAALAEELEFGDSLERAAERCSTGVRQRAALARALLGEPRVLLLDEPLRGIDAQAAARIAAALRRRGAQLPVVWVSHAREELADLTARVARVRGGVLGVSRWADAA